MYVPSIPYYTIPYHAHFILRGKGTHICAVYYHKCTDFTQIFAHITTRYHPKLFISGAIKKNSQRSCARSNLRLPSFNVPEYLLLQANFNVEMSAMLIFEPFVPASYGMTGRKTVIIRVYPSITALYPPKLAPTACSRGPFHLGIRLYGNNAQHRSVHPDLWGQLCCAMLRYTNIMSIC